MVQIIAWVLASYVAVVENLAILDFTSQKVVVASIRFATLFLPILVWANNDEIDLIIEIMQTSVIMP